MGDARVDLGETCVRHDARFHSLTTPDALGGSAVRWRRDDGGWAADVVLAPWGAIASPLP